MGTVASLAGAPSAVGPLVGAPRPSLAAAEPSAGADSAMDAPLAAASTPALLTAEGPGAPPRVLARTAMVTPFSVERWSRRTASDASDGRLKCTTLHNTCPPNHRENKFNTRPPACSRCAFSC